MLPDKFGNSIKKLYARNMQTAKNNQPLFLIVPKSKTK